jgi:large subunit ribosomal protein L10
MKGKLKRFYAKALAQISKTTETSTKTVKKRKEEMLNEIIKILKSSRSFLFIDLEGLENRGFKEIRSKLSERGVKVKVFKNKIFLLAMKKIGMKNIDEVEKYLNKPIAIVYSDKNNVFELASYVDEIYYYKKLKPGDKAPFDITIPSGPTDIPPGPMMSVFGRLKIPVQPREGRIFIMRDTVVAKQGQEISAELASLLNKLGITPLKEKPRILMGYEDGIVIDPLRLKIDYKEYESKILGAYRNVLNIASEIMIPEPDILKISMTKAFRKALNLAVEMKIISSETIDLFVRKALINALKIASILGYNVSTIAGVQQNLEISEKKEEKEEKEEEKKEEVSEEQIAEGLSALFG